MPFVKAGRLRAIAVTGAQPACTPPGVPTLGAAGLKGFGVYAWYDVSAPAAAPQPGIARLSRELKDAPAHPRVQTVLAEQGLDSAWAELAQIKTSVQSEVAMRADVAHQSSVQIARARGWLASLWQDASLTCAAPGWTQSMTMFSRLTT